MPAALLAIYLNDHLMGAALATELCKRSLRNNQATTFAEPLETLLREVQEDRVSLERVMDAVGASRSRVKQLAAVAAERFGRLKLNGRLVGYSPLSRLVEFEALLLGVAGKRALWRLLASQRDPRLANFDFGRLEQRADEQLARLEQQRLEAGRLALVSDG